MARVKDSDSPRLKGVNLGGARRRCKEELSRATLNKFLWDSPRETSALRESDLGLSCLDSTLA